MRRIKGVKAVKYNNNCHCEAQSDEAIHNGLPRSACGFARNDIKHGFTLAEVLITLTIIGVIAALTIPNLMKKWEDQHTVSAVKTAYSILNNALIQTIRENGSALSDISNPEDIFISKLKVEKTCNNANGSECFITSSKYKSFKGNSNINTIITIFNDVEKSYILANGMAIKPYFSPTQYYGWNGRILVDLNGKKGPNRLGYDSFFFALNDNGISLSGINVDHNHKTGGGIVTCANCCNLYKDDNIYGKSIDGISCSTWIIKHGNSDYKYRDVSAEW